MHDSYGADAYCASNWLQLQLSVTPLVSAPCLPVASVA